MMRFADEQLFATIKTKMLNVECACAQGRMLVQDSHHARNRINEFFFFFFVLSILIFARGFVFFLSLEKQCPISRSNDTSQLLQFFIDYDRFVVD